MVVHFFDPLSNHGNLAVIDRFVRPDYIQHDPNSPDGAEALGQDVASLRADRPELHLMVERAIAEGDLVLLHSHSVSDPGTEGQAVVDIFRVQDERSPSTGTSCRTFRRAPSAATTCFPR
ncbi:hypothetical protein GRC12_20340 [Streptomyces griseorubiginosus]|nr:hypothetical protein [Streptomyces griseorubiginosus]